MPLLHKNHDTTATDPAVASIGTHTHEPIGTTAGPHTGVTNDGVAPGTTSVVPPTTGTDTHGVGHHTHHPQTVNQNPVVTGQPLTKPDAHGVHHGDPLYASPHAAGATSVPASGGALGSGTTSAGHPVDPTHSAKGAGTKAFVGKVEHAIGVVTGSASLKAKGLEKEREAEAIKVQARELNEAERLEQEANLRRDRAAAHGAHSHPPGATGVGAGSVNVNEMGGIGIGGAGGAGSVARGGY